MKIIFLTLACVIWGGLSVSTGHAESNGFCEYKHYSFRKVGLGENGISQEALLNKNESLADLRKLAISPGAYGHSELGYRMLARSLGYNGQFGGSQEVEYWIFNEQNHKGISVKQMAKIYDKWVVNASMRLSVPLGNLSRLPASFIIEPFFRSLEDRYSFMDCMSDDVALASCGFGAEGEDGLPPAGSKITAVKSQFGQGQINCKVIRPKSNKGAGANTADSANALEAR